MQPEPAPHDSKQQHGFERERDRRRGRGTMVAEARHQRDAQRAAPHGSGVRRDHGKIYSKLTLNSYARSPPIRVNFSAAPSAFASGGKPSSSNSKRLTPGGPLSSNFGIGSAQSGVGPSTNRLTSFPSGAVASTSTFEFPSRLTSRIVSGLGSPTLAGFGTVSSAADSAPSSVLATLAKVSSLLASTGIQSFSQTAYWISARSVTGLSLLLATMRSGSTTCCLYPSEWPPAPSSNFIGAGHKTVTASTLSDLEKSKRGGTPESPAVRQ